MPKSFVVRPIVRTFSPRFQREAVAHVRAGGIAILWDTDTKRSARMVVPHVETGDEKNLGLWALLDLGRWRYTHPKVGPFRGLSFARVPTGMLEIVIRWAERDSIWPGPTRRFGLDCLECGACCRDNKVVLEPVDVARFRKAGREDLLRAPYTRRAQGKIVLTLLADKRCHHLAKDNKCDIYAIRPDPCSSFPMGSECCLSAREDEFGWHDGLPPQE